jgi:hypothetical protein
MDRERQTLDDILDRARSEAPVMTREESRALLASAPTGNARETASSTKWSWIMMTGAILATAIGIGLWISAPVRYTPSQQQRTAVGQAKVEQQIRESAAIGNVAKSEPSTVPPKREAFQAPAIGSAGKPASPQNVGSAKPLDVEGVRMIDPPGWLLDSLGIRVMEDGKVYHDPAPFGSRDSVLVFKLPEEDQPLVVSNADAPHITSWSLRKHLRTRMITDEQGKRRMTMVSSEDGVEYRPDYSDLIAAQQMQDTGKLSQEEVRELIRKVDSARNARGILAQEQLFSINRLIPIRVVTGDNSYYIFWYDPTAEFLDLLPSPVLVKLRLEAVASEIDLDEAEQDNRARMNDLHRLHATLDSLIDRRIAGGETIQPAEANPGSPIMETSRVSDGAISLYSISPNPNHGEFRVHYAVRETRTVGFSVYDINGNRLQVTTSGWREKSYDNEVVVRLKKDLPPGIYLLVLSTDRGERAVQRLVIDR